MGEERVNENNKWRRDNGADLWVYPRGGRGVDTTSASQGSN